MDELARFSPDQLAIVNDAAAMAEEVVSDFFKMSANQWLQSVYDVKTLVDLATGEIVNGPYAQIIRYQGKRKNVSLGSSTYDFYKICIQDHAVLATLHRSPDIRLFPFSLYIVSHELIHIVRFTKFLQNFNASPQEKLEEEKRVHHLTRQILNNRRVSGLEQVLTFYRRWHAPMEDLRSPG